MGAGRHVQVHVVQHGPAAQAHRGPLEKDVAGDHPTGPLAPGAVAQVHEHLPYATRGGSAGVDESGRGGARLQRPAEGGEQAQEGHGRAR